MAFGLRVAGVETDADSTRQQSEIIRSTSCPYELIHAVVVLHGSILRPQRRVSDVLGIPTLPSGQALSFAGQDAMAMSFAQDPCSFLSLFLLVQKPRAKEGLCFRMILLISRDKKGLRRSCLESGSRTCWQNGKYYPCRAFCMSSVLIVWFVCRTFWAVRCGLMRL